MIKKFISAFLFGLLLAGGEAMAADQYEAEDATTSSTEVGTSTDASGGKYIKMEAGSLTFTVKVETAGIYNVDLRYSETYGGNKIQNVAVNGTSAGTISFTSTGSTNPTFSNTTAFLKLKAGTNTIAITNSWGWVDIDYITLSKKAASTFNVSAAPADPKATEAEKKLYAYLKDNFQKKTISGVMTDGIEGVSSFKKVAEPDSIYTWSGKYPALVGFDFMHATGKNAATNSWYSSYTNSAINMAKELWIAGGIPEFTWHWKDPSETVETFYCSSEKSPHTDFDFTKALNSDYTAWDTTTTQYKQMIANIDHIAELLDGLQKSGVAVLWRPLHEGSGAWFWWGAKGGAAYVGLYHLLYDRLVNYHGLHNLIWVWNSDGTDYDSWYPGDDYVDIIGRDFYYYPRETNHASLVSDFEALGKESNYSKIVTLAENGSVPYPADMQEDNANWSYFMPWYGTYTIPGMTDGKYCDDNTPAAWKTIMNDSYIITLGDMPGWNTYVNACDTLDTDNHIEAECADYSGTIETGTGISGTGAINMQNATDYVKATFTVPADAKYEVSVGFVNKYGKKGLTCAVNGDSIYFEDSVTHETKVGTFSFKAGENVVSIIPTWTWSVIDYINITKTASSVANVAADERINVYPAKVTNAFTVAVDGKAQVSVCDINGRLIMSQLVDGNTVIPASKLQVGIYLVKIETANNSKIFKLIK